MNPGSTYQKALILAQQDYLAYHPSRHHAFASSVTYYVTGLSMGASPSIHTHLASWFLAGDGFIDTFNTLYGELTLITPDIVNLFSLIDFTKEIRRAEAL